MRTSTLVGNVVTYRAPATMAPKTAGGAGQSWMKEAKEASPTVIATFCILR